MRSEAHQTNERSVLSTVSSDAYNEGANARNRVLSANGRSASERQAVGASQSDGADNATFHRGRINRRVELIDGAKAIDVAESPQPPQRNRAAMLRYSKVFRLIMPGWRNRQTQRT